MRCGCSLLRRHCTGVHAVDIAAPGFEHDAADAVEIGLRGQGVENFAMAVENAGGHGHVPVMKQIFVVPVFALVLSAGSVPLATTPLHAQEAAQSAQGWIEWGMSLFGGSIADEVAPAISDMKALADQFGPAIAPAVEKFLGLVDDVTNYEMPEMQPNGDILIRRKPEAPPVQPPAAGEGDSI